MSHEEAELHCEVCGQLTDHELHYAGRLLDSVRCTRCGTHVELSAREFALAEIFLLNPGQVLTREQLLDLVWGYDFDPGSNVVDVYVGYLRRKLGGTTISNSPSPSSFTARKASFSQAKSTSPMPRSTKVVVAPRAPESRTGTFW